MAIKNSPRGNSEDRFSSFHRNSPHPEVLQMYLTEQRHDAIKPLNPLIRDLIQNVEDKVVLDVGCGLGSIFCQCLINYGLKPENLYSLDPDPKNFEFDAYPRVNKVVGSVENMDFESNFFDVVHSNEITLDNQNMDYVQALKEINRVLKSGGFYLANEHLDQVAENKRPNSKHLAEIVEDEKLLGEIGFKPVVKIKYIDSPEAKPYQFILYLFQKK